jgi:hypothetical protein
MDALAAGDAQQLGRVVGVDLRRCLGREGGLL